jgi:TonB family protein
MSRASEHTEPSVTNRRIYYRLPMRSVCYVEMGDGNGGVMLNLSEGGCTVQAAEVLAHRRFPRMRFRLPKSERWVEAAGKMVWHGKSGKEAGIEFVDLPEEARQSIREWMFKQTFADERLSDDRAGGRLAWEFEKALADSSSLANPGSSFAGPAGQWENFFPNELAPAAKPATASTSGYRSDSFFPEESTLSSLRDSRPKADDVSDTREPQPMVEDRHVKLMLGPESDHSVPQPVATSNRVEPAASEAWEMPSPPAEENQHDALVVARQTIPRALAVEQTSAIETIPTRHFSRQTPEQIPVSDVVVPANVVVAADVVVPADVVVLANVVVPKRSVALAPAADKRESQELVLALPPFEPRTRQNVHFNDALSNSLASKAGYASAYGSERPQPSRTSWIWTAAVAFIAGLGFAWMTAFGPLSFIRARTPQTLGSASISRPAAVSQSTAGETAPKPPDIFSQSPSAAPKAPVPAATPPSQSAAAQPRQKSVPKLREEETVPQENSQPTESSPVSPSVQETPGVPTGYIASNSRFLSIRDSGGSPAGSSETEGDVHIGQLVYSPQAIYPDEALRSHLEGIVKLQVIVGPDGSIRMVSSSSGPSILVAAATQAVSDWRYEPTLIGKEPMESECEITFVFRL